jgi:hypothetical protein
MHEDDATAWLAFLIPPSLAGMRAARACATSHCPAQATATATATYGKMVALRVLLVPAVPVIPR